MKVAALDLGSNSFLCLICESTTASENSKNKNEGHSVSIQNVLSDQVKIVRLGQGVGQTGSFHPDALVRAEACLKEFKIEIDRHKPDKVLAMATSAARDAKNGHELIEIGKRLNIPIQIIAGKDEARITYLGATSGLLKNSNAEQKTILLIDIGGGSTELIVGRGEEILFSKSLDVGVVRFTERLALTHPISTADQVRAEALIKEEILKIKSEILKHAPQIAVAVAGTPTTLAAAELGGFDAGKIDGYVFTEAKLKSWEDKLAKSSVAERIEKFKIEPGRADVIYIGALILRLILNQFQLNTIEVSTRGVRYGVALEMLSGRI